MRCHVKWRGLSLGGLCLFDLRATGRWRIFHRENLRKKIFPWLEDYSFLVSGVVLFSSHFIHKSF